MKKHLLFLATAGMFTLGAGAAMAEQKPGHMEGQQHGAEATKTESAHADVKKHSACAHCGMDREKFSHSRMLITYSDGSATGVCSIHCTVTELKAGAGKTIKIVEVADLNTKKMIEAEKAFWVIGGSRKGVMTKTAKWAFAKKEDADAFIKKHGGKPATYKEALVLAEKD